jgi:NADH-quinone oxidoreductase subunit L
MTESNLLSLIIFAPLFGAAINWFVGRRLRNEMFSGVVGCGTIAVSMLIAFYYAFGGHGALHSTEPIRDHIWTWIQVGNFRADFGLAMDRLSGIYACFVTFVGLLIHIFATGYMHGEDGYYRFFAYMNLFMFSMLTLVLGDNFLLMFVGWEGVGLCSYLLIGYYTQWDVARVAAKKAFVANRIGDWGVVLGILLIFTMTGSISFFDKTVDGVQIQSALGYIQQHIQTDSFTVGALFAGGITSVAILLFIGATGKSAQIPLFVWLPDAMAGPTPVSALIHAATMVTAGIYMVVRCNIIYQLAPTAMLIVAVIGAATAIFAATIGLAQNDIKKVLAYSTVSQLGYMFLACGVGAFVAAVFHVLTHAFFKALLFLGSGSVIHGMHHEQDMRNMGNLKKYMPITWITMMAGWLAICGFPLMSGFFSKDEILWKTWSSNASVSVPLFGAVGLNKILWVIAAITALVTAVYMTRLMVMTFWGTERFETKSTHDVHAYSESHDEQEEHNQHDEDDENERHHHGPIHPHEDDWKMKAPLVVLAVFSVVIGFIGVPHALSFGAIPNYFEHTLDPVIMHPSGGEKQEKKENEHGVLNNEQNNQIAFLSTPPQQTDSGEPVKVNTPKETKAEVYHDENIERLFTGISVLLGLGGIGLGWLVFTKDPLKKMPNLLENKYWVDEIYDKYIINPIHVFSRDGLWKLADLGFVDGLVNGAGRFVAGIGDFVRNLQVGFVRSYAALIFFGALFVICYFIGKFFEVLR